MRSIFIIFNLLFFANSIAQDYKPLLDNSNEWHLTSCFSGCLTDVYYAQDDTIVDGLSYKILDGYHYISRTFLLHEDIAQKKVNLKILLSSGERNYLLYNFALNVGDSIDMKNPITPFPENAGYYILDSIVNRPLVDGNLYKHFYLSPAPSNTISTNNAVWVEGVGSLSLINAPSGKPDINEAGQLSCVFKNGELFYANLDSISSCEPVILSSGIEGNALQKVKIISPIIDGRCQMFNAENVRYVDVFEISGKKLNSFENNGQRDFSMDFSKLKTGIYFVVAITNNLEKKTFKVIVQ